MTSAPKSMLIVAGHALWDGEDWEGIKKSRFPDPDAMKRTIAQHVRDGCKKGVKQLYDVIAFSGGQTRKNLKLTEAQGMANFATCRNIEFPDDLILESFARDSFENVVFSLLAFYHNYKGWPEAIGVISMPHKSIRFMLMATGLHFDNFTATAAAAHVVGEAEEAEAPWSLLGASAKFQNLAAETQQCGFAWLDFQVELPQPFAHLREICPRVGFVLEAGDKRQGVYRLHDPVGSLQAPNQGATAKTPR